jgi:hypothetical protein
MRYARFLMISLFLCMGFQHLIAQKTKFTGDSAYLSEVKVFMGLEKEKDPGIVYTQFANYWQTGKINSSQKQVIIKISNNLLKKRARPNPHFDNFLRYILSVLNSKTISGELDLWLQALDNYSVLAEFNIGRLDKLIGNLAVFNDSSILYQSRAVVWKHNAPKYRIGFDLNSDIRIQFPQTDLLCFAKRDSTILSGTSGYYYPVTDQWVGTKGTVNWERAGFSKDSVFAKLNNYKIDLKFSEYKADTVEFTNKKYLKRSLIGRFEEKVLANVSPDKASYPKFFSYETSIDISKVVPNIDYSGGFAMEGSKFNGYGNAEKKAELYVYKGKDVFAKASALSFTFDKNNIIANNAKVFMLIDQDTLWHPGLYFNYLIKNERVSFTRSGGGLFRSNFYDDYHKLEINVNEITFDLKDTLVLFKSPPATTYKKAIFESSNYFSYSAYNEVALMDRIHPLEAIRKIADTTTAVFDAIELARYLDKAEIYCVNMLTRLSDMGFVNFDLDTKVARPEQKLFDYIRSNYGYKDYDAIQIVSEPPKGTNAILNLKNNVLTVYGVESFVLSDNRRVGVVPDSSVIRIKKDLEIDFDGVIQAGLTWLHGKKMTFYYDSFLVQLKNVDSLSMVYKSDVRNKDSAWVYTPVASTVDSITGLLRIDYPKNKSGRKIYPEYPILESHKKSYVFYEQHLTADTVYNKKNFYVENYPFELDSLNTIQAKNISFRGNLNSGDVFPRFDETLVVMDDKSLGFIHKLDSTGMPIYGGLAKYDNTVKLDNSGLKGHGSIKYLNTRIFASQFNFFPDSMNTDASHIDMARQSTNASVVKYPKVLADSVHVFWAPKKDQMQITTLDKPFSVFEDKAQLTGQLELTSKELGGQGTLKISDAQLDSKTYTFYDESFNALAADFIIQPVEGEKSPFLTYNVKAEVDFNKKLGIFNSNGENSYIDLPINQYKCYMNYFSWHMGINQIDIGTTQTVSIDSTSNIAMVDSLNTNLPEIEPGFQASFTDTTYTPEEIALSSKFISTHPLQDSLTFYATSSSYDIKNFIVKTKGVKFIKVADAIVFPSSAVTILPEATIKTIENARILADRDSCFHKFYDASVNIFGASRYTGSADYEYYDRLDSMQMLHFSNISVNSDYQTVASGDIKEEDAFKLSPEFLYFGKIFLTAPSKNIEFDGYTKIGHLCENRLQSYWLQFKSVIDPDSIVIPIGNLPVDNELRKLTSCIYLTADSMGVYPSFLTTKRRINDIPVLEANGLLTFNQRTGYYEITDSAKVANPEKEGNFLSLHRKVCIALGEGKMDLGGSFGQVKLSPVGFVSYNLDTWQANLEIMLGVDFFFNDMALDKMASLINDAYSLPPVNTTSKEYQRSMKELVGLIQRDRLMNDFSLLGGFSNVPSEMEHTLFFSDLKMKWNNNQKAWQSDGKIGLGNIKNKQINKMLDGYVEIKKMKNGDILNIYLEIDPKNWYFFTYTRGTLKTISSDNDYNNAVTNLKDKYRKSPVKDEENPYMFFPATDKAKDNFIEEMKKQKLSANEQKDINYDNVYDNKVKDQTETETPENEDVEGNNNQENNIIETEEVKTDEIKKIEEIKKKQGGNNEESKSENTDENKEKINIDAPKKDEIKKEVKKSDDFIEDNKTKLEEKEKVPDEEIEEIKYEEEEEEEED